MNHARLWTETSRAVADFYDDLKEHDATDNVVLLVFTEFGRRVHDNGAGTDHGSGELRQRRRSGRRIVATRLRHDRARIGGREDIDETVR